MWIKVYNLIDALFRSARSPALLNSRLISDSQKSAGEIVPKSSDLSLRFRARKAHCWHLGSHQDPPSRLGRIYLPEQRAPLWNSASKREAAPSVLPGNQSLAPAKLRCVGSTLAVKFVLRSTILSVCNHAPGRDLAVAIGLCFALGDGVCLASDNSHHRCRRWRAERRMGSRPSR